MTSSLVSLDSILHTRFSILDSKETVNLHLSGTVLTANVIQLLNREKNLIIVQQQTGGFLNVKPKLFKTDFL